jgi:putative aldouronate transport system substrate-binding protein
MKRIALLLALMIVLSSADSCSEEAAQPAADPGTGTTTSTEAPYEFSLFGNLVAEMTDADKAFFEELGKQTNTVIDVQLPPSSNYSESLTIMMASGDYPDLVLFPNHTDEVYLDGVRNEVILPLNEYIENAPNIKEYSYDISWQTLKVMGDDNIYGIPRTSIARADGFIVRQDWIDTLGFDFTEGEEITLNEFGNMLDAFTTGDPDGNGVADTYGLGLSTGDGNLGIPGPIAWAHGLIGWHQYEGEEFDYMDLTYSRTDSSYKEALAYMADLWERGLIDPDWPTLNTDAQRLRFDQGIEGVQAEFAGWMPDVEKRVKENNPDGKCSYIVSIVKEDGTTGRGGAFSTGFWGEFCVMATAENPQKIVDVLDYMLSDDFWMTTNYGIEGQAWNFDTDGNRIAVPENNHTAGRAVMRRNNAPEFFVGLNTAVADRDRVVDLINICIDQAVFSQDAGFRPATASDPTYIDTNKELAVVVSQIIVGDLPVDAYDEALEAWYAGGGQQYIEEMNAGIKAFKGE